MLFELILQEAVVAVFVVPWKFVQDQLPLALESKDRVGEGRYVVVGFAKEDLDGWITSVCEPLDFGFGLLKMFLEKFPNGPLPNGPIPNVPRGRCTLPCRCEHRSWIGSEVAPYRKDCAQACNDPNRSDSRLAFSR